LPEAEKRENLTTCIGENMSTLSEEDPWCSIADLLEKKIPVAKLATAIEDKGIEVRDRFDRVFSAIKNDKKSKIIKEQSLDLLASYYDLTGMERLIPGYIEFNNFSDVYKPLKTYGWLKSNLPDFNKIQIEIKSEGVHKGVADDKLHIRARRTYQIIIAALCNHAEIDYKKREIAGIIARMTNILGVSVTDETIHNHLKGMSEEVESRKK
jgi:hypothetical protein